MGFIRLIVSKITENTSEGQKKPSKAIKLFLHCKNSVFITTEQPPCGIYFYDMMVYTIFSHAKPQLFITQHLAGKNT